MWAAEPVPEWLDALRLSLKASGLRNARAYRLALSDHAATGLLQARREWDRRRWRGWLPVPATTVDAFVATHDIARGRPQRRLRGQRATPFRGGAAGALSTGPEVFCEIHGYLDALDLSGHDVADYLERFGCTVRPLRAEPEIEVGIDRCTYPHTARTDAQAPLRGPSAGARYPAERAP